jgi:hypothetical protein
MTDDGRGEGRTSEPDRVGVSGEESNKSDPENNGSDVGGLGGPQAEASPFS